MKEVKMHLKFTNFWFIVLLLVILAVGASAQVNQQENERYKIQWRDYTFYTNKPMPTIARELTFEA